MVYNTLESEPFFWPVHTDDESPVLPLPEDQTELDRSKPQFKLTQPLLSHHTFHPSIPSYHKINISINTFQKFSESLRVNKPHPTCFGKHSCTILSYSIFCNFSIMNYSSFSSSVILLSFSFSFLLVLSLFFMLLRFSMCPPPTLLKLTFTKLAIYLNLTIFLFAGLYFLQVCFSVLFLSFSESVRIVKSLLLSPCIPASLIDQYICLVYSSLASLTPTQLLDTLFRLARSLAGFALIHVPVTY